MLTYKSWMYVKLSKMTEISKLVLSFHFYIRIDLEFGQTYQIYVDSYLEESG